MDESASDYDPPCSPICQYSGQSSDESDGELYISEKNIWNRVQVTNEFAAFYSRINEYFESDEHTDVTIICQERSFRCHRLALAAASGYFHKMFNGNFKESHQNEVVLEDIDSVTFEKVILPFVYKGEVAAIDEKNVFNMLRVSDIFELKKIEDHCVHYLTHKNIPMECALDLYLFASRMKKKSSLVHVTSKFILEHSDHFIQDSEFLRMSLDDFRKLLDFRASSLNQEERLLDVISKWVCNSTDKYEERKSSFTELTQKVHFKFVSPAYVAECLERNVVDTNGESRSCEVSNNAPVSLSSPSLYLYVSTETLRRRTDSERPDKQTSILSLQERGSEGIDWHLSHTITPPIQKMRILESEGQLYCLKRSDDEVHWNFSLSSAIDLSTNMQLLASPELPTNPPLTETARDPFMLCRLQKDIYLSGFHREWGIQRYNYTESDAWSWTIPASIGLEPKNIISDDAHSRLYIIDELRRCGTRSFLSYDPRVGEVTELNKKGIENLGAGCTWPGVCHEDKIYLFENDENDFNKLKLAIYDPIIDRWDRLRLKSHPMIDRFTGGARIVSFDNGLWIFGLQGGDIYTAKYDAYKQTFSYKFNNSLYESRKHFERLQMLNLLDVVSFIN